jgi:DNA-binding response OmpR family regulator
MAGIVLVEDNADYRFFLQTLLERSGMRVRALPDAWWLLAALEAEPADLVITDLYMPRMDGLEAVRAIRRTFPELPIIGMTGAFADSASVKAFTLLGADIVLRKPVPEQAFLALVRRKLARQAALAA